MIEILVTNDDGIGADGIRALAKAMEMLGNVTIMAPDREQSATSHALTLHRPLRMRKISEREMSVDGTPTDAVLLGVHGFLKERPALVVSGINHGPNMGNDVLYSGTVAAASEGTFLGIPSVAISLASKNATHFETAAQVAIELVERHARAPAGAWLLNVNVPDIPLQALRGTAVTRLGRRHKAEDVIRTQNPRGETVYWVGAAGEAADAGEGTDFHAVGTGYVSVTPLQIDLTHRELMPGVRTWLTS